MKSGIHLKIYISLKYLTPCFDPQPANYRRLSMADLKPSEQRKVKYCGRGLRFPTGIIVARVCIFHDTSGCGLWDEHFFFVPRLFENGRLSALYPLAYLLY
jgi:hypothetical protein